MPKIETKTGWLISVDTDNHTLEFRPDEARIITVRPGELIPDNKIQYRYDVKIEWDDIYFWEKVRIRLEDNVVVKIDLP